MINPLAISDYCINAVFLTIFKQYKVKYHNSRSDVLNEKCFLVGQEEEVQLYLQFILTVFKFAIIACNQEYTWMRELIADIHHLLIVCLLYL